MEAKHIDPEWLEEVFQDIDLRLAPMWVDALAVDEWTFEFAWTCLRVAYGHGYVQALIEPEEGKLLRDHGLPVPSRGGPSGAEEDGR